MNDQPTDNQTEDVRRGSQAEEPEKQDENQGDQEESEDNRVAKRRRELKEIEDEIRRDQEKDELEKQKKEWEKQLPGHVKREIRKTSGPFELIAGAIFGGILMKKWSEEWLKQRETYINGFFRDLAILTDLFSFGLLESRLGRGSERDLHLIRAYRTWINEKVKEFKEIEINASTRRSFYFHHALELKNDKEAWAWLTSLATTSDWTESDIEKFYEYFSKKEEVVVQYELKDPKTGKVVDLVTRSLPEVYWYIGNKIQLGIETGARRVGTASKRLDNWHGGIRKPLINPKTKEIVGVAVKTLDEFIYDCETDASLAAGRRADSPSEFDMYNRYETANEVEAAVRFLEEQIERLRGWLGAAPDDESREKLEKEITHCRDEIKALSINLRTGLEDFNVGVQRPKSFMLDFSKDKPLWLKRKLGEEHEPRFLNLEKINGYSLLDVAMHPTYLKWLWGFHPDIILRQEHIRVSTTFNWEDLFKRDRREAFKARVYHEEYGARTPKGEFDKRREDLILNLENGGFSEAVSTEDIEKIEKYAKGYNEIVKPDDADASKKLIAAQETVAELARTRVDHLIERLQRLFVSAQKRDLAQDLAARKEQFLKELWGIHGEALAEKSQKILESLSADDADEFEIIRDDYVSVLKAREVLEQDFPFIADVAAAFEYLKKGTYGQLTIHEHFRPSHDDYRKAFETIGEVKPESREELFDFLDANKEVLGLDAERVVLIKKGVDEGKKKPAEVYDDLRQRLKAIQLTLKKQIDEELALRMQQEEIQNEIERQVEETAAQQNIQGEKPRGRLEDQVKRQIEKREKQTLEAEFEGLLYLEKGRLVNLYDAKIVEGILRRSSAQLQKAAIKAVDDKLAETGETIEDLGEYHNRIGVQKDLLVETDKKEYLAPFEENLLKILQTKEKKKKEEED